jgi:ATP phosphoribosyltransferase regulatory subunit
VRALNSKDLQALRSAAAGLTASAREALLRLAGLHGGVGVLAQARRELPAGAELSAALSQLEQLVALCPPGTAGVDLADLHGYRYYTGVTFAAYVAGSPGPVLRGGRYDDIGRMFGRARPATGFSIADLREAAQLGKAAAAPRAIIAPHGPDAELNQLVASLRAQGQIVVRGADGQVAEGDFEFDREIRKVGARWQLVERVRRLRGNGSTEADADGR